MTNEAITTAIILTIVVTIIALIILLFLQKEEAPKAFSVAIILVAMVIINGYWIYQVNYFSNNPEGQRKLEEQRIEFSIKKEQMLANRSRWFILTYLREDLYNVGPLLHLYYNV